MPTILSIFLGIILFSLLIFVHELGHFLAAKASGVQVNEFAIFMGPAIFKKQVGETLYSIRTIPIGGYCAMEGEDEDTDNPRSFQKAKWWKRLIILVSGAGMNFLIGILLFAIVMLPAKGIITPQLNDVLECCSFRGEQGLLPGDRILEMDGEKIYVYSDFNLMLNYNPGEVHDLVVLRDGEKVVLNDLVMARHEHVNEDGSIESHMGISFSIIEPTFAEKMENAWYLTVDNVRNVRISLVMLLTGRAGIQDMMGPVALVSTMSEMASEADNWVDGLLNILYFGGFIAVNLGVMNLLPIPALDGGRVVGLLLTTGIEKITKKKLDPKYEGYIHGTGMILLLLLMAIIIFKDVFMLFKG